MAGAAEILATATGLSVTRGRRTVLRGVDLQLRAGEVTALLGPNGAGKSTLLSAFAGLLRPDAGSVSFTGTVAAALQTPALARRSVRANVELALAWWGVPRAERRGRADAALRDLHADHLSARRATRLSGGEQRRVHLARAVATAPDVLLLDEPFAGLDPIGRAALLEDASSVLRSRSGATLVVAHDRAEAWALADRIVVLLDGRVAASGACQQVLDDPPTAAVARFLGYDGELARDGGVLLTRPAHVHVDAEGEPGRIDRVIPVEDGYRVRVALADGVVHAVVRSPAPRIGDAVSIRLTGGTRFPASE